MQKRKRKIRRYAVPRRKPRPSLPSYMTVGELREILAARNIPGSALVYVSVAGPMLKVQTDRWNYYPSGIEGKPSFLLILAEAPHGTIEHTFCEAAVEFVQGLIKEHYGKKSSDDTRAGQRMGRRSTR